LSLTYLGYSAVQFELPEAVVYVDPFFRDPVDWHSLAKGDIVLFSHGHFDHGVQMAVELWERWHCQFVAPKPLVQWMQRKFKKRIPHEALIALGHNETIKLKGVEIKAIPAHHPINRLGKTLLALFARSSAPGKPVNGYCFNGYYHAGDTIYLASIAESLKGMQIHTACLPIGGKYAVASPQEALTLAQEMGAQRIIPMHWQPLVEQVPFRYQSSDLVKLAKASGTSVQVCALAIGEKLEQESGGLPHRPPPGKSFPHSAAAP
jgi:L-ascorbate metabolism protein UlaG (beta-lactamase superfamily)